MDFAGAARTAADLIRGPFMATWLIEMKLFDESHVSNWNDESYKVEKSCKVP